MSTIFYHRYSQGSSNHVTDILLTYGWWARIVSFVFFSNSTVPNIVQLKAYTKYFCNEQKRAF